MALHMARSRVLIADDHPVILERVSQVLGAEYEIVGTVSDGLAAVDAAVLLQPDVLILDISMPILTGLEAAARLSDGGCVPRIVFLSVHEDPEYLEAARSVGAYGYVLKRMITADLLLAVRHVLNGEQAFPATVRLAAPESGTAPAPR
jgi:DNA-binding NarL/FixJ family response regulator